MRCSPDTYSTCGAVNSTHAYVLDAYTCLLEIIVTALTSQQCQWFRWAI